MQPLYTEEEFQSAKSRQKLALQCLHCKKTFYKTKHEIQTYKYISLLRNIKNSADFCSNKCQRIFECPPIFVQCENCGKEFKKIKSQVLKSKHHFCSKSCSCTYQNQHKTKGTRCSRLEQWLQIQLTLAYPGLEFHFNRKDTINSELDIYIPSLKLAFELNGIFHYEPIFSKEKLDKIQNNDQRKSQACLEQSIELCIIDTSKLRYFKEKNCIPFLEIIKNIILLKLQSAPEGVV